MKCTVVNANRPLPYLQRYGLRLLPLRLELNSCNCSSKIAALPAAPEGFYHGTLKQGFYFRLPLAFFLLVPLPLPPAVVNFLARLLLLAATLAAASAVAAATRSACSLVRT
jgi:hypothetical protein